MSFSVIPLLGCATLKASYTVLVSHNQEVEVRKTTGL